MHGWDTDRRTLLGGLAALTLPAAAPASPAPATMLAPAAMQADLTLLGRAYAALHPGLWRYLGHDGWTRAVARATAQAARPLPAGRFHLLLAGLTASVRCGHSYANPNNHRTAVREALLSGRNRVPFGFRWLDGQMVVTGNLSAASDLVPGSRIARIDGYEPRDLLAAMLPLARADGGNDAKRVAQLEVDGRERFSGFDVFRPLLDTTAGDVVRLRVRPPGGATVTRELAAMTEAERAARRGGDDAFAGWRLDLRDGVGILTLPSWATYNSKADWKGFLKGAMDRLVAERARGLIVDVRGNEGGEDCGNEVLARLIDRPLALPAWTRHVAYRRAPEALFPWLDTWDDSFRDWGSAARDPIDANGLYRLVRSDDSPDGDVLQPVGPRFAGPLIVLADAACSSATFQFCLTVRKTGLGRIVGGPTGGNLGGINGGAFFFLKLPATGMEVDLPLIATLPPTPQPDGGIAPDIAVPVTAADIAAGRDSAMARALALLA